MFAADVVFPGDVNGDGIPDLVGQPPRIDGPPPAVVALGKGDGTYGTPTPINCSCRILGLADLNRDGKLDLVAEELPEPDVTIFALRGNGDGTFSTAGTGQDWRIGQASAVSVGVIGDVNGDGNPDVVLVTTQDTPGEFVQVVPGNGDMSFRWTTPTNLPATAIPWGVALGDLNGDGRTDIAVANRDGHSVSIFLNQGAFNFNATADIGLDRTANDVLIADFNHDGKMDLAVAATADGADGLFHIDGYVYVLPGNGNGTFGVPVKYQTDNGAIRIVRGDFNRDGIPDLATANDAHRKSEDYCGFYSDTVSILPGNADGTFAAASSFALGNQSDQTDTRFRGGPGPLTVADVNRDSFPDLVVGSGAIVMNQAPDPNWAPTVTASATAPDATHTITLRAAASDVDQDALTFQWTDSGGQPIEPTPAPCRFTPSTLGVHTFTVTVNDRHGHTASSSVSVDFGSGGGGGDTGSTITVTAPATGATVTGGTPFTIRWTAPAAMANEELIVSYTTDGGATFSHINECLYTPVGKGQCVWNNPGPDTTNAIIALTTRDADVPGSGSSGVFAIHSTAGAPPWPWQHRDIGAVGAAGSASYASGVFTVNGSGADIWGTADEFHYVSTFFDGCGSGDIDLVSRVDSVQNVNAWTKAGLMVRGSLTAAAMHASIVVSPSKGIAFQRRTTTGGTTVSTSGPLLAAPVWLRLSVRGSTVSAYYHTDANAAWTKVGDQTFAPATCGFSYAGLAVTSHADGTVAAGKFSNVSLTLASTADNGFSPAIIGGSSVTGTATFNGDAYTITNRGADIWGTADQFTFMQRDGSGTSGIAVAVSSLTNSNAWAKAGVMYRNSVDANSPYVALVVSPEKGIAMQYRATAGGASAQVAAVAGAAPTYLRLTRSGNTYTGAWSADNNTWHTVGTITVGLAPNALVGMAVTSHSTSTSTTAVFRNVNAF